MSRLLVTPSIILILLAGCNENARREPPPEITATPVRTASPDPEEFIQQIENPIKSIEALESTGTETDSVSLVLKDLPTSSMDTLQKAIYGGIFFSDAVYAMIFDQGEEEEMFHKINRLTSQLFTVDSETTERISERFQANLLHKDSLEILAKLVFERPVKALESDKAYSGSLFISSHVLENLYLSSFALSKYPVNLLAEDSRMIIINPLLRCILEQEPQIEAAISLLKLKRTNALDSVLLAGLVKIDSTYDMLKIAEKVRNNQAHEVLSDSTLRSIPVFTNRLRNQLLHKLQD